MGFTLRLMLGFALVLTTCSLFECASTWRRIRQVPPIEASAEAEPILEDNITDKNSSIEEKIVSQNVSDGRKNSEKLLPVSDRERLEKNEVEKERKPKTETSTEKYTVDNKISVNKTNNNDKSILNKKTENANATNIESSLAPKDLDLRSDETKQNHVSKKIQKPISNDQDKRTTTEKVPEKDITATSVSRAENGRSLGIDISKYVSPEFHNKNNVYSFSVSPETEKFTNLHYDLPKSTTSRLLTQPSGRTPFGEEITTPVDEDFDKKYQNIEEGLKQRLEYIDHQFLNADNEFKKSSEENINIGKIVDEIKNNDTTVKLDFIKYKNISNINQEDKNKIHKELDLESGQKVDYSSSYNKTQLFNENPKDYKNNIPLQEDEILSETLPETSDTKLIQKSVIKPTESKHFESENIPEIVNLKEGTSLTKPPSLNQTEDHKLLLSNKIETEIVSPVENGKIRLWDSPHGSTIAPTSTTVKESTSVQSKQKERTVYVPYDKDNVINVSKRGSTKFIDTIKVPATTPSYTTYRSQSTTKNKLSLARKENKTFEQSVLENQVYPVQIPPPHKHKEDQTIDNTSEKSVITEDATIALKLYTISNSFQTTARTSSLRSRTSLRNQTEVSTSVANVAIGTKSELTTDSINGVTESTTVLHTTPTEETTVYEVITELTTNTDWESTTLLENITTSDTDFISGTPVFSTTTEIDLSTTTMPIKDGEKYSTYKTELTTGYEDNLGTTTSERDTNEDISLTTTPNQYYSVGSTTPDNNEGATRSYTTVSDYYSEYDDRSSKGRVLKSTSSQTNFNITNADLSTQTISNISSTTQEPMHLIVNNSTNSEDKTPMNINDSFTKTTSDYRENTIIKHTEAMSSTKSSVELIGKYNVTNNEGEDINGEDVTEDYGDSESEDHSNASNRNVKPYADERTSDTTPFILPINVSGFETDSTDFTTIADTLELEDDKSEGNGGKIAAIVISCIGAVCLIILAGLLFIMRKRHKRFNYGQRCTPVSLDAYSVDNVSVYNSMRRKGAMRASKRSYGNPAFDDPTSISHSLNFQGLAKFANDVEGIAKEFEEIPQVTAQMNELPEGCETKNRYANVIPLPESRVYLNAMDGYPNSDYINANYVTGPRSTKGYYIACQAPLQNTVDDFWRMVWEQQSKVILMLTHLFENGSEKCIDYLPPSEVLDCHRLFGDFQVTLKKREVKEKYVISNLQLKNMVSNSWREVTHLWYLGWPEKGVPLEANSLIAFLIEARSYIKAAPTSENGKSNDITNKQVSNGTVNSEQSPVIVHCSPGTGRTGTVIACDIAIREFELTRQLDIPKTVYRIRRDRASAVQTKEQYAFIYTVICLYATKLTGGVLDSL